MTDSNKERDMSSNLAAALILGASGATLIAVVRMALENRRHNREEGGLLTRQGKMLDQIERQAGLMGRQDDQCAPGKTVSQGTVHAGGRTPSTPPPPAGGDHRKRKGKQVV